jgi:glutamyl-tRNA synthetase
VDNGKVPDWNDPRFPTVQGVVRRGVTMGALRRFIYAQGASRNIVLQEWDKFWSMNKDEYEPTAPRFMGVATQGAVPLSLTGGDTGGLAPDTLAAVSVATVPSDSASAPRPMRIGGSVFLEGEDAKCCQVGDKVESVRPVSVSLALARSQLALAVLCLPRSLLRGLANLCSRVLPRVLRSFW